MPLQPENVWDYPRPAICQAFIGSCKIIIDDKILAQSQHAYRILETSHPPTYYLPPDDINMTLLQRNQHQSLCEWKGKAIYLDYRDGDTYISNIGWFYEQPTQHFYMIQNYISFYASKLQSCFVNDEQVIAQEGDFYGGWITSNLKGPFKGGKGTFGW